MAKQSKIDHGIFLVIVGLAAWAIPGAGHFIIKEKKRAVIIFVTITLTFLVGIYIGSIAVIDPVGGKIWYYGQTLTTPAVTLLGHVTQNAVTEAGEKVYISRGHPNAIGQIYTCIAGLLNLLCIISAVYMAYCGRGEMIGEEEEENVL
jgi:hypothetical protein